MSSSSPPPWTSMSMASMINSPNSVLSGSSSQSPSDSDSLCSKQKRRATKWNIGKGKMTSNRLEEAAEIIERGFDDQDLDDVDDIEEDEEDEEEDHDELNDDEEEDEDDEGNASAFTDPSWYGSPFTRRNSTLAYARSPQSPRKSLMAMKENNKGLTDKTQIKGDDLQLNQKLDAFQKGLNLARRSLFDLDNDLNERFGVDPFSRRELMMMMEELEGEKEMKRQNKVWGKQRANPSLPLSSTYCGKDILTSFEQTSSYLCASCGTTLALQDELISKAFSGRDGKAYLFFSILNINQGKKEDRQLLTGLHTVADLTCSICQRSVGWSYIRAFEASQRYKEGKFILERASLHKSNNWHSLEHDEEEEDATFNVSF